MVAASTTRDLVGVHLDLNGTSLMYTYVGTQSTPLPYSVTPYLTNNNCDALFENITDPNTNRQLVIDIPSGSYSATGQMIVSDIVRQVARIQMIFIDPNGLSVEGQRCLANSSTSGNFARLAQCVNSEVQYKTAFGQDAWDRCGEGNGNPCESSNHGYSCGENDTTCADYNALYDNELGCYMCTFNILPSCSTDNFAIRPERFDVGMPDPHAPNLLRAGQGYGVSLTAKDAVDVIPVSYDVAASEMAGSFETNETKYFESNWTTVATDAEMHGATSKSIIGTPSIVDGLSNDTDNSDTNPDPIYNVSYSDVGEITLHIYDKEWAYVDNDDTPDDCNSTTHYYICGDKNVTFIPHHFRVDNIHLRNHSDGNFTYLSDDLNMSAHIDANISAMNANDDPTLDINTSHITQNFRQGNLYYENPVNVDLNITEWLGVASRHSKNNSTHKHDIPTESLLGFGGSDIDGTHLIPWNETNTTQQLMFNYTRQNNQTVNPFDINGTDINISVQSTYIDTTGATSPDTAVIEGTGIGDRNATFIYGRAKPLQYFYDNITATSVLTPVSTTMYCDLGLTGCQDKGLALLVNGMLTDAQSNEASWWFVEVHDSSTGDGNITLIPSANVNPSDPTPITLLNGTDNTVLVTNTGGTPNTVNIDFGSATNTWLIYNKDADSIPSPFYRVRFIGTSGWTGKGKTGHVVGDDINEKKTRRLEW